MTLYYWQSVEAMSKTMGCRIRRRPLLSTYHIVSCCLSSLGLEKDVFVRTVNSYDYGEAESYHSKSRYRNVHVCVYVWVCR